MRFEKFVKLKDPTCACNDLTNFECEVQAAINRNYVNFHGKTREITLGELNFWRVLPIWSHCDAPGAIVAWTCSVRTSLQSRTRHQSDRNLYNMSTMIVLQ